MNNLLELWELIDRPSSQSGDGGDIGEELGQDEEERGVEGVTAPLFRAIVSTQFFQMYFVRKDINFVQWNTIILETNVLTNAIVKWLTNLCSILKLLPQD
jgi:hypothetical protein